MKQRKPECQHDSALLSPSQVAGLLNVSVSTLRTYELEGLVSPQYRRGRKCYSYDQVTWLSCMRFLVHDEGISIPGLTRLLRLAPCWEIANCSRETKNKCKARALTMEFLEKKSKEQMVQGITERPAPGNKKYDFFSCVIH